MFAYKLCLKYDAFLRLKDLLAWERVKISAPDYKIKALFPSAITMLKYVRKRSQRLFYLIIYFTSNADNPYLHLTKIGMEGFHFFMFTVLSVVSASKILCFEMLEVSNNLN